MENGFEMTANINAVFKDHLSDADDVCSVYHILTALILTCHCSKNTCVTNKTNEVLLYKPA